jgi:DNA adenine methylase
MAMEQGRTLKPLLKWAGGKRQIMSAILPHVPTDYNIFIEPFVGGASVLFELQPQQAVANDINAELINLYTVVRNQPSALLQRLKAMSISETEYLRLRELDRNRDVFNKLTKVERAARTIYLNKAGFNGLYRVNQKGEFNVPFGKRTNVRLVEPENLLAISKYLRSSDVRFMNGGFEEAIAISNSGDFIYCDPPYAPLDDAKSTFTSYAKSGFGTDELERLKIALDEASQRGANWLLSNVKSRLTVSMFDRKKYQIIEVLVRRPINSNGAGRQAITEILVLPK